MTSPAVRYRFTEAWIDGTSDLDPPLCSAAAWSLAAVNGWLAGSARIGVERGRHHPVLRLDCVRQAGGPPALDDLNRDASRGVVAASHALAQGLRAPADGQALEPDLVSELAAWCRDASWECAVRDTGAATVNIGPRPARFEAAADGQALVAVELADVTTFPEVAREAVGHLLLAAGCWFRGIKGTVVERDDRVVALLATATETLDSATAVDRALGALTAACDAIAEEVLALSDTAAAGDYLARRHWTAGGCPPASRHPDTSDIQEESCQ